MKRLGKCEALFTMIQRYQRKERKWLGGSTEVGE